MGSTCTLLVRRGAFDLLGASGRPGPRLAARFYFSRICRRPRVATNCGGAASQMLDWPWCNWLSIMRNSGKAVQSLGMKRPGFKMAWAGTWINYLAFKSFYGSARGPMYGINQLLCPRQPGLCVIQRSEISVIL